jgi:N-acetylneuraminic acid mutarotase
MFLEALMDKLVSTVGDQNLFYGHFSLSLTRTNGQCFSFLLATDMYSYDLINNVWRLVPMTGSPPTPRHSHSAVVYEDSMFVFGGYDGNYRNDFHALHLPTMTWTQVVATSIAVELLIIHYLSCFLVS